MEKKCLTSELRRNFFNSIRNYNNPETFLNFVERYIKILNASRWCLCYRKPCEKFNLGKQDLIKFKKKLIKIIDVDESI